MQDRNHYVLAARSGFHTGGVTRERFLMHELITPLLVLWGQPWNKILISYKQPNFWGGQAGWRREILRRPYIPLYETLTQALYNNNIMVICTLLV